MRRAFWPPGLGDRLLIHAAFLLHESLARGTTAEPEATSERADAPSSAALRALVYRLDPGSALAEALFLSERDPHEPEQP